MPLPDSVADLIKRYDTNRKDYHQPHYNETQTRIDFVNPLFAALGWDMDNREGLSEIQREVIHEDAVKIGGTTKAPDYGFRAGGQRKFFLETKKPTVVLKLSAPSAYQLRRYAWTVKLPVSLLTNFEEFVVYDGRVIPDHKDGAATARLDYFRYTDYADRWDDLAARFSREAVLNGSFDRYAAGAPNLKSRIPVDTAFLTRISDWRVKLAKGILRDNPHVSQRELNYAVQMLIDRIIFLRICEDRGVETQYRLESLQNGARIYQRLLEIFHHADERYNSGLFHFEKEKGRGEPDDITPRLNLDDRLLRDIISGLYGDKNPYVFSYFPADILGQVYEQFLGKVIRCSGTVAEVEDKPEVKKAGGVYYTPTYIVDYIVQNTVGKLVEGKTPAQVAKLTVLDPACGSGSFLIGAYQFLLDWHLKYYIGHDPSKAAKGKKAIIYLAAKDEAGNNIWRLTTAEKKRILLANVYGVDIDTQAVEVTKLSLLLKVLEGESAELINNTLKLYKERALPDLENNIKCGNSLIGPDFYTVENRDLFDMEARLKINTFDWKKGFPDVMNAGGFDAVIGNPPYVSFGLRDVGTLGTDESEYYRRHYENSAEYKISLYAMFMQAAIDLLNNGGLTSFIVPDSFLLGRYFSKLRRHILDHCLIEEILMIHARVFYGATVGISVVYNLKKTIKPGQFSLVNVGFTKDTQQIATGLFLKHSYPQSVFEIVEYNRFRMFFDDASLNFVKRMEDEGKPASDFISIHTGVRSKIGQKNISAPESRGETWRPGLLSGSEIGRYSLQYAGNYLNIDSKLLWSGGWNPDIINATKLLIRQTGDSLTATLDTQKLYHLNNVHSAVLVAETYDLRYILALFNSRCMNHFYHLVSLELGRTMAQTDIETLEKLPIHPINFANSAEKAKHDKMVGLVESMLKLHQDKAAARLAQEKAMLQQQIEATDAQIDRLVYDLYGLTEEEIQIVEGTT